jgi:DNA ligase (NAD+)
LAKLEERIRELRELINYHSDKYYNEDSPVISDFEYDKLMQELKELESEAPELVAADSPTQRVGGSAKREAGVIVEHRNPMLSLQDVFAKEEVLQFVENVKKAVENPVFVVETKIDGLSVSLRYENGELVLAETRGDGVRFGEDVTANAKVIKDVKKKLKEPVEYLEVRGEVYMTEAAFNKVNEQQELLGKKIFANPRNCAAGTLRQLDSKITKERGLSLFVFNIQEVQGIELDSHIAGYKWLKKQGIRTIELYYECKSFEEIWQAIEEIGERRGELSYDIDGAVVKLDNRRDREVLGATSKVPKWAIAYKYPPERKETRIHSIEVSVGRTGKLTPTAVFEPIRLCGTTVSRATLHNQDFIDKFDICIGSVIAVEKSGDVIPKCVGEIKEKRAAGAVRFRLPDKCPVCGAKTERLKDLADTVCTNANCPAQLEAHLINFVGRGAMDIKGFGERYIELLLKEGYIKDIADIFTLKNHRAELIEKGLVGKEKNTDKLLAAIEKAKENELDRLITGLGIANIGRAGAHALAKHFGSLDAIMQADSEELTAVEDIGAISAQAIYDYMHDGESIKIIEKLKKAGVNTELKEKAVGNKLQDMTFVITGTLPTLGRSEAAALIESEGGKVSGSVSKKTTCLLAGENAGSKLAKAESLNIKIIDEGEFLAMLKS